MRTRWRGLAGLRANAPHISDLAPLVWRAPEGPEGQGGLRDRPLRAIAKRVAISRAAGPEGAGKTRGATSTAADQVGGRTQRCPEHHRRRKHRCRSGGRPDPKAPGKPVAPQAPPEIRRRCKHRPNQSELLVVLRVLVGLAAARTPERADRRHLFRRQREGEDVEVLALTLRVTGLGQGQGAELVVPAQDEA